MMVSLVDDSSFEDEKNLLRDVFHREMRDDGAYWIYQYDQRYYKVLSACAKLRLRTKNLPEGNPSYIEIRAEDWARVVGDDDVYADAPSHYQANMNTPSPEPTDEEPDIESAVAELVRQASYADDADSAYDAQQATEQAIASDDDAAYSDDSLIQSRQQQEQQSASMSYSPVSSFPSNTQPKSAQASSYAPANISAADASRDTAKQAALSALRARETALQTREEAVHQREAAVLARESALAANEQEIELANQALADKEGRLARRADELQALNNALEEQTDKLRNQKQRLSELGSHIQSVTSQLLLEDS